MTTTRRGIDWRIERDRIDILAVAISLLGPPPGRPGDRSRRSWWRCPFGTHDDQNPSFAVDPGKGWCCYGCGEKGDAAALVMRLTGKTFPQSIAYLRGGLLFPVNTLARTAPSKPRDELPPEPTGLPEAEALAIVVKAEARLWSGEGKPALDYLTGRGRGLTLETIRKARLGVVSGTSIPKADGTGYFQASGVVIPWFDCAGRLALVKIRQPEGRRLKYAEAYRNPARVVCYPSAGVIRPGLPLIATEGEFDCLLLGQSLGDVASVITLGSASARPDERLLRAMLPAWPWYVATDADRAGDNAAEAWPAQARRIRPPVPKDWSDTAAYGVDVGRWVREVLAGNDSPRLFTWEELSGMRWGPAIGDPTPGIIID